MVAALAGVAAAAAGRAVLDAATGSGAGLVRAVVPFASVYLASFLLSLALVSLSGMLGERLANHLRLRLYRRLLRSRWQDLAGTHSEQNVSRLTSDVDAVATGTCAVAANLTAALVQAVGSFFLLASYDVGLAACMAAVTPAAVAASLLVGIRLKRVQQQVQAAEADYRVILQDGLSHPEVVKAFCAEERVCSLLADRQGRHERLVRRRVRLNVAATGAMGAVFAIAYVLTFVYGAHGVREGAVSFGTFTAFLTLVGQMQSSLGNLGRMLPRVAATFASADRLRETDASVQEEPVAAPLPGPVPAVGVRFRDVTFSYDDACAPDGQRRDGEGPVLAPPILSGASLVVGPGEVVGLMGPSGIGKTTVVRLLLGLVSPQAGSVEYLRADASSSLSPREAGARGTGALPAGAASRSLVSYVPQGNTLLSGSIRENLLLADPGASEGRIGRALEAARCDFVRELPEGLDTVVGERGAGLSEGQAQRLAIARALLRPAGLLVLDEATSALDARTELEVMRAIRALDGRPTCVVVTHRAEVMPLCDRVITLRGGAFEEEVRHDEGRRSDD